MLERVMGSEVLILVCVSLLVIDLNFHGTISVTCYKSIQERDPPLQFRLVHETDAASCVDAVQVVSGYAL